ncbi:fasciclin domain-containing protein [Draconibacterium sp. IB214405]|uniref:fasciclin domain-containing protein n=1 Tax=Draconibacterium sp. IB214405 TaxID=3097352 RepID=UPI002A16FB6B|nr:fasciclin domain-containing protein [Draconibacterium sp. IB214405]MDX8338310.1 fasciclin domain-containing protein [Draconibacterium sp. IB214405]
MKTVNLKSMFNFRSLTIAAAIIVSMAFVSCEKENDDYIPQSEISDESLKAGKSLPPAETSIAAIAIDAGFSELVSALFYVDGELETELVDMFLNGTDQYTVFAPTNDAFQALYDSEELESLLGAEVNGINDIPAEVVLNVLLYHVTDGRRAANSVVPKKNPKTIETLLDGATFNVDKDLKIWAVGNTANLVPPYVNISASNGIIHVIDAVILPIEL